MLDQGDLRPKALSCLLLVDQMTEDLLSVVGSADPRIKKAEFGFRTTGQLSGNFKLTNGFREFALLEITDGKGHVGTAPPRLESKEGLQRLDSHILLSADAKSSTGSA